MELCVSWARLGEAGRVNLLQIILLLPGAIRLLVIPLPLDFEPR